MQALAAAVDLELADRLRAGPRGVETLAEETGCATEALRRLLRALCALEVCRECPDGRFALGPAGRCLSRDAGPDDPGLRDLVLWWSGPMWSLWGELGASVRSGQSARERLTGRAAYGFLEGDERRAALFHGAMRAITAGVAQAVTRLDTWTDACEVVDVGGGHGELAAALAQAHARLRVTVLDRPDAAEGARALMASRGVSTRVAFVAGDFFAQVPAGADRYLLKSILHNWDDAACARILAACAAAAPRGARLLLVERLRPQRLRATRHDESLARADLNMLIGLGGRERSLAEYAALLERAGFAVVGLSALGEAFSGVEARRV